MIVFDLIRHGRSQWMDEADAMPNPVFGGRMPQTPLSDKGRQQAVAFGLWARAMINQPTHILSSDAIRSTETHRLSWEATGWPEVPYRAVIGLRELDWGDWERRPKSILKAGEISRQGASLRPPRGESYDDVYRRLMRTMNRAVQQLPPDSYIWLHTHQNVIKSLMGPLRGWSAVQMWSAKVPSLSITRVRFDDGKPSVAFFGTPVIRKDLQ